MAFFLFLPLPTLLAVWAVHFTYRFLAGWWAKTVNAGFAKRGYDVSQLLSEVADLRETSRVVQKSEVAASKRARRDATQAHKEDKQSRLYSPRAG